MRKVFPVLLLGLMFSGCSSGYIAPDGRIKADLYNQEIDRTVTCDPSVCDEPARLLSGKAPSYPRSELARGLRGTVIIIYYINTDGSTGDFEIESSPSRNFSSAAIAAVREWKYQPATMNGEPVRFHVRVAIPFTQ